MSHSQGLSNNPYPAVYLLLPKNGNEYILDTTDFD